MTELEKYEKVNSCETVEELKQAILELGGDIGVILGRENCFDAKRMSDKCGLVFQGKLEPNILTRNYGIRQQMFYLMYYSKE